MQRLFFVLTAMSLMFVIGCPAKKAEDAAKKEEKTEQAAPAQPAPAQPAPAQEAPAQEAPAKEAEAQ